MVIAGRNAQAWVSGILAIASGGFTGVLIAQSTPGNVEKFEVASIRPAIGGANRPGMQFTPGGGLRATNVTLNLLIQIAYDIPADRLSGGPRWADSAEYDVVAKGREGGAPAASMAEEQQLIAKRLQALLADRFQLVIQREWKEISGYELIVAKTAPLFTESKLSEKRGIRQSGVGVITAQGTSMEIFA